MGSPIPPSPLSFSVFLVAVSESLSNLWIFPSPSLDLSPAGCWVTKSPPLLKTSNKGLGWWAPGVLVPAPTPGESGLLLTKVASHHPFVGYRGPRELSERKLVRNVRKSGDVYYNTGDVLTMDHEGFLYFRDRLGDTFRSEAGFLGAGLGRDHGSFHILEGAKLRGRGFPIARGRSLASELPTRKRGFSISEGAALTGPPDPQKGRGGAGERRGLSLPGA
ncbi:hypothetical protein P7K49_035220, partial [Saguinus oedipus]